MNFDIKQCDTQAGFGMVEVLVSLTLLAVIAVALLGLQMRSGARIHEVYLQTIAFRHFQSARALGQNIASGTCGSALAARLYLTETIPDVICVSTVCDRRACAGTASWGARPDQTFRLQ